MTERFSRCLVLVIGNFNRSAEEALAMRELGARVTIAGLAVAAVKKQLSESGVDTSGIVRSRKAVLSAALDRLGGCDAVLCAAGDWEPEFKGVREAEMDSALIDGRSMRPLIAEGDPRYDFLRSPREWAAFTLARAAGAGADEAREFAAKQQRGHEEQDTIAGSRGRRSPRGGRKR